MMADHGRNNGATAGLSSPGERHNSQCPSGDSPAATPGTQTSRAHPVQVVTVSPRCLRPRVFSQEELTLPHFF